MHEESTHVFAEHYEARDRGELTDQWIDRRFERHSLELCPVCHLQRLSYLEKRLRRERVESLPLWAEGALVGVLCDALERLDADAERDFEELMGLDPEHWRGRVERARKRFQNPMLADRLLDECRRRVFEDPLRSQRLAELAFEVALRSRTYLLGYDPAYDLGTLAMAHKANALRVAGDLTRAEEMIRRAFLRLEPFRERTVAAELAALTASLRRGQRRFAEALEMADAAAELYRASGEPHLGGRVLVTKSHIYSQMGEPEQAIETLRAALELIDRHEDPRLYLCAQHDLTCYLAATGACREARELLETNRELYESFDDFWTRLRRRWVEGKIARGLDELDEASAALAEVRSGFIEEGVGYDAALASLELALVYLDQGLNAEVQQLAREMIPIFRSQDVHREAAAALVVFVEAASREVASRALVEQVVDYLQRARDDPGLRFDSSDPEPISARDHV